MTDSENIQEYITRVVSIVNQIKGLNLEIFKEDVVSKVLMILAPKYDMVVVAIEEAKDITKMTLQELTSSLLAHKDRVNWSTARKVEEKVFYIKGEPSGMRDSEKWASRGRGRDYSWGRGRSRG